MQNNRISGTRLEKFPGSPARSLLTPQPGGTTGPLVLPERMVTPCQVHINPRHRRIATLISMNHGVQNRASLRIAETIASALPDHPEWITQARSNLDRWTRLNADASGLVRCYDQWRSLLDQPIDQIRDALSATTDEGQRLRQNSPFAGVLPPQTI